MPAKTKVRKKESRVDVLDIDQSHKSNVVEEIKADVAAFAAQLGLATDGAEAGFDDTDFRPQKAKEIIGDTPKQSKQQDHSVNREGRPGERKNGAPSKAVGPRQGKGATAQDSNLAIGGEEGDARIKERTWNTGVGPRPGEKQGKPLLGSSEPSLWYEAAAALPPLEADGATLSPEQLEERRSAAEHALANEAAAFENAIGRRGGQDVKWLQEVRRSGTTADKVAAMTLLLQESAVANLRSLDELLRWVGKSSGARAVAGQAIDALREIFIAALLPDRKLKFFEEQPIAAVPSNKDGMRRLLYFYVEDQIKRRYAAFVGMLEEASRENLDFLKEKTLKAIAQLLAAKPEQEAHLLAALVNKLGDPSRKLASKAGYLLRSVLEEHPGMKVVMAREVERFLFRPGLQERARYYGVIFLNQMPLSHNTKEGGTALAQKLVDIYFTLFKLILEGKLGHGSELAAAREAKAQAKHKKPGKRGPSEQRHAKPLAAANKGPSSVDQAAEVDARMLGALLAGVRRAFPYVDGSAAESVAAHHADSLFRVLHTAPLGVAVQALALLFQLLSARSAVSDRFYRALYEVMLSPEVGRTNKAPMFLSLLFRAMRADVSSKRVCAFVKRLLQVAVHQQPNFACGCLMLISQLLQEMPALWNQIMEPEEADDGMEHFVDAPDPDTDVPTPSGQLEQPEEPNANSGRLADRDASTANGNGASSSKPLIGGYDMRKREPLHAGAERVPWWELVALASHMHPSVAAMARSLLAGAPVVYHGDPLRDLSLTAFLDTFVQRKPKAHAKGSSLMQPLRPKTGAPSTAALGSAAFDALARADVAPDSAFFQKYQALKTARSAQQGPKKKKKKGAEEDEDASSGEEVSDSDEAVDEFLDAEESDEDDGDEAYSYNDLAAAFGSGGRSGSDVDQSESASDVEADGSDMDQPEGEAEGRSAGSGSDEESEDLDILALAESSGEEDGVDSQVGSSGDESSEGEWVMHNQPASKQKKDASGTAAKEEAPDKGGTKQRRRTGAKSVFAAAEDYEHLTQDNAAEAVAAFPKRTDKRKSDSVAAEPVKQKRRKPAALAAVPKKKKEQKLKKKQLQ
ncbi:g7285 [Coccomyxa elongata]